MSRKETTIEWLDDLWDDFRKPAQGYILLLNGSQNVDKLAIAQAVKDKLPEDTTRLIDDHTLIGPAESIFPGRGAESGELRKEVRRVSFDALSKVMAENPKLKFIMTACLHNNEEDARILTEHARVAGYAKVPLLVVNFTDDKDHEGKVDSLEVPERGEDERDKLKHQRALRRIVQRCILVDATKLSEELREEAKMEVFTLDVTNLSVEQVVGRKMRRMYQ